MACSNDEDAFSDWLLQPLSLRCYVCTTPTSRLPRWETEVVVPRVPKGATAQRHTSQPLESLFTTDVLRYEFKALFITPFVIWEMFLSLALVCLMLGVNTIE